MTIFANDSDQTGFLQRGRPSMTIILQMIRIFGPLGKRNVLYDNFLQTIWICTLLAKRTVSYDNYYTDVPNLSDLQAPCKEEDPIWQFLVNDLDHPLCKEVDLVGQSFCKWWNILAPCEEDGMVRQSFCRWSESSGFAGPLQWGEFSIVFQMIQIMGMGWPLARGQSNTVNFCAWISIAMPPPKATILKARIWGERSNHSTFLTTFIHVPHFPRLDCRQW